jgi:hypothetical protein
MGSSAAVAGEREIDAAAMAAAHDRLTWNEWIFDTGESRG